MSFSSVVPALPVEEIGPAVEFYVRVYGFESRFANDGMAVLMRDQVELHLWAASDRSWEDQARAGSTAPAGPGGSPAGPTSAEAQAGPSSAGAQAGPTSGRQTGPASPVRSGGESFLAGTASCRIHSTDLDALYVQLQAAGVLHPIDEGWPTETDHGTREFHTLDLAGNLLTFFTWR